MYIKYRWIPSFLTAVSGKEHMQNRHNFETKSVCVWMLQLTMAHNHMQHINCTSMHASDVNIIYTRR